MLNTNQNLFLNVYNNRLTGSIPPELGNLNNLQNLYLDTNQLTGSIPPELGNLNDLQGLNLSGNQLTGNISSGLGNLNNLKFLVLDHNQLTGNIPPELSNLSILQRLELNNNQISGSIPLSFVDLSSLDKLYFYDTYLCEPQNEAFQEWLSGIIYFASTNVVCPQVEIDDDDIVLIWDSFQGAASHQIYRNTTPYFNPTTPYVDNVYSPFVDVGVAANQATFFYQITFVDNVDNEFPLGNELGYFVFEIVKSTSP